jgi:hypothetical protein
MTIECVTVFTAQPAHEKWRSDYVDLIRAQAYSAERVGHTHRVMTDRPIAGLSCEIVDLGEELMSAMLIGVIKRLEMPTDKHLVFLDADCLVNRPIGVLYRKHPFFDLALTIRVNERAPVINGAMYVRKEGAGRALMFFRQALKLCLPHWGGDQEAISQAAAPVPSEQTNEKRNGCNIAFLSAKHFAPTPKHVRTYHEGATVVHFKGATKGWQIPYARDFLGYGG